MLGTYHRITINGVTCYHEYNTSLDTYEAELLTEDEFFEIIKNELVEEEIDIDESKIEAALRRIPTYSDRDTLKIYIRYLERLANE